MSTTPTANTLNVAAAERVLTPRFGPQLSIEDEADGRLRIVSPDVTITLPRLPAAVQSVVSGLGGNQRSLWTLSETCHQDEDAAAAPMLYAVLARLASQGVIAHHLTGPDGIERAVVQPSGTKYRFVIRPLESGTMLQLSRFCIMHRESDRIKLVSPVGQGLIHIADPALMTMIGGLMTSIGFADLLRFAAEAGLDEDVVCGFVTMCLNAGFIDIDARDSEENQDRQLWNVHDLMFHASSRYGHVDQVYGGMFRHIDDIEPAPALRPLAGTDIVPLPVPVLEEMVRDDPPFQAVVESRCSIYDYDETPITRDDLGEFLYRTARVRWIGHQQVRSPLTGRSTSIEISSRPYPGGGRGYELELYVVIDTCLGIEPGLYHYDPAAHTLSLLRARDNLTESLISYAGLASPGTRPQVLIVFGARFRRMMWKYDRMAYAAILKDVGVLMQQMYLAATVMQLAPSAQGSGNVETFAAATGHDPLVESSVGEFILGSRKDARRENRPAMLDPLLLDGS